ncbi:uncharacterized protein LOC112449953 [Kryptolebias marmoratus]|uniref:uncharacterized protein LOC112449953 n=1 Tax=Kryptolebias marmoratus TaxID=37003 RepID=UPI000D52FE70|nr:uncharacterized protein LOC112449953 [Kryptolebias marmoratus]
MLLLMIFCHVWLLTADLISCTENSTGVQAGRFRYVISPVPSSVIRFSVPENHHVCLPCQASDSSDVIWTHQNRKVLVTRQGTFQTNEDKESYLLQTDGGLCLQQLDDSDAGEYHCNQQLVAELQVLSGHDFTVSAGRTLLLPCRGSSRYKQRWFRQQQGQKKEVIFTRVRDGTEKPERGGKRLSYRNDALQIEDLQPEDAGEYLCNSVLQAQLSVLEVTSEKTSVFLSSSTTTESAGMKTDVTEVKKKKKPENALLLLSVFGFGMMTVLMVAACVLLTSMKCIRKRKKYKNAATKQQEDSEQQLWITSRPQIDYEVFESPSQQEEMIHYASLGQQNWRERPSSPPPNQNHNNVVYSSVIITPATKCAVF